MSQGPRRFPLPLMDRRGLIKRSGALALMLSTGELAWGAGIVAVRVWPASEYTRVTIESDRALMAQHLLIKSPDRLVVDILDLELSATLRELVGRVRADDPFIASVRVGQYQPGTVRLVVDLKQPSAPQLFRLAPVAAYQHRLVFDLYPTEAPDPLQALLREKAQAQEEAARAVQDALGEFIERMDQPGIPEAPPVVAAKPPAPKPAVPPPRVAVAPPSAPASPRPPVKPSPPPAGRQLRKIDRLIVVALDPGHGGEDPGAIGPSGLKEKDVVLAVARQLRDRLNAVPGMRAMLTRDGDFFVPLHERVNKARRVQADLFVSIHADAFMNPQARGASVFALSAKGASSAAARWIARRENTSDLIGGANLKHGDAHVVRALLDMSTTVQIKDSLKLGHEVLRQIGKVGRLHKRGVEQAGFAVLKAPDIPSILVETAFISNPEEERKLASPAYRGELVKAVATGIRRYFAKHPPLARHRTL